MLLHNFVEAYALNTPDAPCITQGDSTFSYSEVVPLANRLANGLISLDVIDGKRVAVLGENAVEHLLLLVAASKTGSVLVPLNYRLAPVELSYIIKDADVEVLIVLEGMDALLEGLREHLSSSVKVFTQGIPGNTDLHGWLDEQSSDEIAIDVSESQAFLQLYTSGTTGSPKGVLLSQYNVISCALMMNTIAKSRANAGTVAVICAPLFHIGGLGGVNFALWAGQHVLLHRTFDPIEMISNLENYDVNSVFMVPAMIMAVLQIPGVDKGDFSKLQQITYGASPISETLLRKAMDVFGCEFVQLYGMTETCGGATGLTANDHHKALSGEPELLRSVGRPLAGVKMRIIDEAGAELPAGEVGEVLLKAETNMIEYHNLPEATASSLTDGWVHTGDAGTLDENGYLFLKDRIKDMVVSGGENIYPVEVENAVMQHDLVIDAAVIGVPDEKFGEALRVFVVLKPETDLCVEDVIEFCRDKIAGYKIPRQLEVLEVLPRNASGKIQKTVLREPFWKGTGRGIG